MRRPSPTAVFKRMGELGFLGLDKPEEYGGQGGEKILCLGITEPDASDVAGIKTRTARVLMPATSDPASGSVIPRHRIFSPAMAGAAHSRFCSSLPKARIGGIAMSVFTATAIARPPDWPWTISSASTRLE